MLAQIILLAWKGGVGTSRIASVINCVRPFQHESALVGRNSKGYARAGECKAERFSEKHLSAVLLWINVLGKMIAMSQGMA